MSFKKITQFEAGNFNAWYNFGSKTLPKLAKDLRANVIPAVDEILESMLGPSADGKKKTLNIHPYVEEGDILTGATIEIIYVVEDFQVKDAPKDAIDADTEAIKNTLEQKGYIFKEVVISVESGELKLTMDLNLTV